MSLKSITSDKTSKILRLDKIDVDEVLSRLEVHVPDQSTKEVDGKKLVSYKMKITYKNDDDEDVDFEVELGECFVPRGFVTQVNKNGYTETSAGIELSKKYQKVLEFLNKLKEKLWELTVPHGKSCNKKWETKNNQLRDITWQKIGHPYFFLKSGPRAKLRDLKEKPIEPIKLKDVQLTMVPLVKFTHISVSTVGTISCNSELKSSIIKPGVIKLDDINFQKETVDDINKNDPKAADLLDSQLKELGFEFSNNSDENGAMKKQEQEEKESSNLQEQKESSNVQEQKEEQKEEQQNSTKSIVKQSIKVIGNRRSNSNMTTTKTADDIINEAGEEIS